jgi:hypothetical protein
MGVVLLLRLVRLAGAVDGKGEATLCHQTCITTP